MSAFIQAKSMLSVLTLFLTSACTSRLVGPTADAQEQARQPLTGSVLVAAGPRTGHSRDLLAANWNSGALDPQAQARQIILGMPASHLGDATISSSGSTIMDPRCRQTQDHSTSSPPEPARK